MWDNLAPRRRRNSAAAPRAAQPDQAARYGVVPNWIRLAALVWLVLSLPVIVGTAFFVSTSGQYLFVMVFMASGAYTTPGLVAAWYATRHAAPGDRFSYAMLMLGLTSIFLIGVGMLVGLATGSFGAGWGHYLTVPAVAFSGIVHSIGVIVLARSRSGRRAMSVDVLDSLAAVSAVMAPLVVLWGPAVFNSEASSFSVPASAAIPFTLLASYWGIMLFVRLGPGRGAFEICVVGLMVTAVTNAVAQTVHGMTDYGLPAPPLIAVHALNMSMYLFIPLNVPWLVRQGLDRLPPQGQVRGARMSSVVSLAGTGALLIATAVVADERPWTVPFTLGVVSLLVVYGGLRQMATVGETRRLYRQVEEASEERRRLVGQLLERSVDDRRAFAGSMYEQAIAAYTSLRTLNGGSNGKGRGPSAPDSAAAHVSNDLVRRAESVRELMLALRPIDSTAHAPQRLAIPITAYLTSFYEDGVDAPRLEIEIAEGLTLDWVTETMVLQIIRQALHNVWRHSNATSISLTLELTDENVAVLRVTDDGDGFDVTSTPEGTGIASMRTSATVIGSSLRVDGRPGVGTSVTLRIGEEAPPPPADDERESEEDELVDGEPPGDPPHLRLVPGLAGE